MFKEVSRGIDEFFDHTTTCVEARPYEPSQVSWLGVSSAHMLAEDPACLYNPLR